MIKDQKVADINKKVSKLNGKGKPSLGIKSEKHLCSKQERNEDSNQETFVNLSQVLGERKYHHLEKALAFALKIVGKERPSDPIQRFSALLIVFDRDN